VVAGEFERKGHKLQLVTPNDPAAQDKHVGIIVVEKVAVNPANAKFAFEVSLTTMNLFVVVVE